MKKVFFATMVMLVSISLFFVGCKKDVELPTVTTAASSNLTSTSVKTGGNVTADGGGDITARGVCYSTNQNPTISDTKTSDGTGTGAFVSNITGLTAGTTYYIRAYATNSAGTSYGNQINVTPSIPAVSNLDENFQSGIIPAEFTLINDNNTVNSNIASLFPTAWAIRPEPDDTANKVAASPSWFESVTPADRWMITPAISIGTGYKVVWKGKAQDPSYPDGYTVKISQTGKNKSDFTTTAFTVAQEDSVWVNHSYDLTSFAGKTIYIAFIQNSTDMFYIMLDDIKVNSGLKSEGYKKSNTDLKNLLERKNNYR